MVKTLAVVSLLSLIAFIGCDNQSQQDSAMAPANTDTDDATTFAAPLDDAKRLDLAAQTERQRRNDEFAKATDSDPTFRNGLF